MSPRERVFVVLADALRTSFRPRHTMGETLFLLEQRRLFCEKRAALQLLVQAAS